MSPEQIREKPFVTGLHRKVAKPGEWYGGVKEQTRPFASAVKLNSGERLRVDLLSRAEIGSLAIRSAVEAKQARSEFEYRAPVSFGEELPEKIMGVDILVPRRGNELIIARLKRDEMLFDERAAAVKHLPWDTLVTLNVKNYQMLVVLGVLLDSDAKADVIGALSEAVPTQIMLQPGEIKVRETD